MRLLPTKTGCYANKFVLWIPVVKMQVVKVRWLTEKYLVARLGGKFWTNYDEIWSWEAKEISPCSAIHHFSDIHNEPFTR